MKKLLALVLAVAMMIIPMTALADSNFIEPTYYADYTEDVEYVTPEEETTDYVVICRALNVRATASTKLDPIDIIHRGDVVKVVEFDGNWAKIALEDGTNAYVYAKYIDKVEAFSSGTDGRADGARPFFLLLRGGKLWYTGESGSFAARLFRIGQDGG